MNVCFLTSHSRNNSRVFDLTWANHLEYCRRHGYSILSDVEPYDPHYNIPKIKALLGIYEYVVVIGTDIWINNLDIVIEDFAMEYPLTMTREISSDVLNGDLIIFSKSAADWWLNKIDCFQHRYSDGQTCINRLNREEHQVHVNNLMQIAHPSMNLKIDYSGVDLSRYFSFHFHSIGNRPDPESKYLALKNFLEKNK